MGGSVFDGALGLAAWLMATFGPVTIALRFWKATNRACLRWPLHLLFLPSVAAVEWVSVQLLFSAAHDDGEGPPGLDMALIPAVLMLALSTVGYFGAVVLKQIATLRQRV